MSVQTRDIRQNLLDVETPPVRMKVLLESSLTEELLQELLESASSFPRPIRLGVSPAYAPSGNLSALAVSTTASALVIQFHNKNKANTAKAGRGFLHAKVLCNPDCTLFAFDLAPLATSLFYDHRLRMVTGVNVQSACSGPRTTMTPLASIQFAAGDHIPIHKDNIAACFEAFSWDPSCLTPLVLRAWVAAFLPTIPDMEERFNSVKRVNTQDFDETYLQTIAQFSRADQHLASKKSSTTAHEFASPLINQQKVKVQSTRFQNRVQKSSNIRLNVRDDAGAEYTLHGRTADVLGRSATVKAEDSLEGKVITAMTSVGGERATNAEQAKSLFLLHVLQGTAHLSDSPFMKYITSPGDDFEWPETFVSSDTAHAIVSSRALNDSQEHAVKHMLSTTNSTRISMIHGPPGTGKTSVIAAYVVSAVAAGLGGIWLVAQTNVAVKNIAEKLADVGFINWKLLVSAEFHLGWHEHLYCKINKNIIQSDEFNKAEGRFEGCSVVLCTLSMLSNPRIKKFTHIVPITTLVIDEASQIALNDYIPALHFYSSIRKMCFIGDDKQLPPFGQDDNEDVRSVFEVSHLRTSALLLDIQYRMPPQVGDFISQAVYDGQLASNPLHPVKESLTYFIDVGDSCEKPYKTSFTNLAECQAVLKIAANLQEKNKSYCIITPYDAQRNILENEMKKAGLNWQNKCFNVDSFQGNEDDYIIISLVRSKELGFLADIRRTNVMLTRCKCAMYICTTWDFIWGVALDTLVGRMAAEWGEDAWRGLSDIENGDF